MLARLALAGLAAVWLAPAPASAAERTLIAERFAVDLVLARDGSMKVTETVTYRFEGGPFSSVTRTLSTRATDGIDEITASMDGKPLSSGQRAGQVQIRREDGIAITWRFEPTFDATKVFTLSYRVRGALRRSATSDVLAWRAVPGRRSYTVRDCVVRVGWPDGGKLIGGLHAAAGPGRVADDLTSATLAPAGDLPPGTAFDLALEFAPGTVTGITPNWQLRQERGAAAAPAIAMSAGVILLAGIVWLAIFLNSHPREALNLSLAVRQTTPPDTLPVAFAAVLIGAAAEANWSHALATLVDLARRGVIRIEEQPGRTWQGTREYVIHLVGQRTGLAVHESGLVDMLFVSKAGPMTSVKLSAAGRAAQTRLKQFKVPVGDGMVAAGLVSPERAQTRAALVRWALLFVVVAALGFIGAAILASSYDGWPLLVPGSVMVVAVMLLITASRYSVLSTSGRSRAALWRSFFGFVQRLARGHEAIADLSLFEPYLPFAVACGVGHQWVMRFEKAGRLSATPAWFTPAEGPSGSRTPAGALADMLSRARAAGVARHAGA